MKVELLVPDSPPASRPSAAPSESEFGKILDDVGTLLGKAQSAENAFAAGGGDLQSAIYERARADVVLSVATAAAQRTAQALQTILNMQV